MQAKLWIPMKIHSAFIATLLLATCCFVLTPSSAGKNSPCATQRPANGWHTYVDRVHRFCFSYPPIYKRVQDRRNPYYHPEIKYIQFQRTHTDAYIVVWFENESFDLQEFVPRAESPTGVDSPPEPVKVGEYTFYYYGRGGGGVAYPDNYFFDLRGKTLRIAFDGPYPGDSNTPTAETKKLESEILATFRTF
jgi:hypothetical protein